ncbi:hypothetical protein ABUE31_04210 [Mesorhizobium sp. ZMM04-5]|uniref:Uncharacterized protein n=1 Tax=Mesorhizobium marinum TaxID=3228790 RepID=A0ABV3QVU9_9HYPH
MTWKYRGAVNQDGVNFHIWTTEDEKGLAFAVTRTAAIEPQRPVVFRSIEEIAARTGLRLADPPETAPFIELPPPPRPDRPFGVFRRPGGWVEVSHEGATAPMPADIYVRDGIWPEYARLPTQSQYLTSKGRPATPSETDGG